VGRRSHREGPQPSDCRRVDAGAAIRLKLSWLQSQNGNSGELVKRVYAAFKPSDLNGLLARFASDFDFEHPMPQTIWAFAGGRKGHQAFVEFIKGSGTVRSFVLIRESGRKAIYVNPLYTQSIEGCPNPRVEDCRTSYSNTSAVRILPIIISGP
jgi:hypothetical protein